MCATRAADDSTSIIALKMMVPSEESVKMRQLAIMGAGKTIHCMGTLYGIQLGKNHWAQQAVIKVSYMYMTQIVGSFVKLCTAQRNNCTNVPIEWQKSCTIGMTPLYTWL